MQFIYLSTQLISSKCLLCAKRYVNTGLYTGEQIDVVPCPHGAYSLVGEMDIKQILEKTSKQK